MVEFISTLDWGGDTLRRYQDVRAVCSRSPYKYLHLYAFQGDDWGGAWWKTMTWQTLHSWRLGG